jgi:hypothetical protein
LEITRRAKTGLVIELDVLDREGEGLEGNRHTFRCWVSRGAAAMMATQGIKSKSSSPTSTSKWNALATGNSPATFMDEMAGGVELQDEASQSAGCQGWDEAAFLLTCLDMPALVEYYYCSTS